MVNGGGGGGGGGVGSAAYSPGCSKQSMSTIPESIASTSEKNLGNVGVAAGGGGSGGGGGNNPPDTMVASMITKTSVDSTGKREEREREREKERERERERERVSKQI